MGALPIPPSIDPSIHSFPAKYLPITDPHSIFQDHDDFDDEDEDLVRDHVEETKAKAAVKRLNSGGVSSIGSGDRRSIGSGKSFGSHRDSARNPGVSSSDYNKPSSRAGSSKSDASSVGSSGANQQQRKGGVGGRSTTPNGVLSTRDVENIAKSVNNNNKLSNKDWNSSSLKSNASDDSDSSGLRNEPTPILSL